MKNFLAKHWAKKDEGDATIIVVIGLIVIAVSLLGVFMSKLTDVTNDSLNEMETKIEQMMTEGSEG